jgi:hypothetical protein
MNVVVLPEYQEFMKQLNNVDVARDFLEQLVVHGYRIEALPDPMAVRKLADEVAVEMSKKLFPTFYLHECAPPNQWMH